MTIIDNTVVTLVRDTVRIAASSIVFAYAWSFSINSEIFLINPAVASATINPPTALSSEGMAFTNSTDSTSYNLYPYFPIRKRNLHESYHMKC